jgi:lysozyme
MQISDTGLDLIKSFEGYLRALPDGNCIAYRCPAGVPTIGWGCTKGVQLGMIWTREQATEGLRRELAECEDAVTRLVTVQINQHQFDALVSFAYNCGTGALAKSTILKRINAGDYEGAAAAFGMWDKARVNGKMTVLRGLTRRRAAERELFLRPVEAEPEPMPQAVAPPPGISKSGTIWGTAAGAVAGAVAYMETAIAGLVEWAAKLSELGPVSAALTTMGGNVKSLSLGLGIGAAVFVISRRWRAYLEGKPG